MATLILITDTYPLGGTTEPVFIRPEIEALCRAYDRVIIAPLIDDDGMEPLPANAMVTRELAGRLPLWRRVKSMCSPRVWRNLIADRRQIKSLTDIRGSIALSIYSAYYYVRLRKLMSDMNLDVADTMVYTFWFTTPALAATMIDGLRCVSRAHGHDIYPEQGLFLSHVRRNAALSRMMRLYPVSDIGTEYLRLCYPENAGKITTARIGSREPSGLNPDAGDGSDVTLLCVARIEPVKRIPLMCELIKRWATLRPDIDVTWICVGDGSEMPLVTDSITRDCPGNLTVEFPGMLDNDEVHHLLATRHVDAVLLTSYSEGAPIVLCEAISYGVPVIATDVGGVSEIVTSETGALLSSNPTPEEFATVMDRELPRLKAKRKTAHEYWARTFRASCLREEFAREIRGYIK